VAGDERLLEPESSLRLAVCQNLIEGFGGTLHVENRARRGFRIELRYPLAADTTRRKNPTAPRSNSNGVSTGVMTSLIIDPDAAVQSALLYMLSERGYRAVPVATAEEGLDLCQQAQFDCILCDARLLTGGAEVYERMRSRVSRFLFLAETSFVPDFGDFPGKDCAVLRKPVDAADLDRALESLAPEPAEPLEETEKQIAGAG
jgi:CheY-like chemotaxis protein